jgi:hypothetical protein
MLELNGSENRVWTKVHLRDGGWPSALAQELTARRDG